MKKLKQTILYFALTLIFLALPLISADVTQDNYFKYGTISATGQITDVSSIDNVNILGIICSSNNCETSSGKLWTNALTSSNDFIKLTYPTNLLSTFGYGIYMYKEGYIPWEVLATWNGNGKAPNEIRHLTKKESCISNINSLEIDYENSIININTNIQSPISNAGTLDYLPEELKSYYSANVNLNLEIKKDAQIFYTETKPLTMLFSESKDIAFSKTASQPGEYEIKVYTTLENEQKCLAYNQDSKKASLMIPEPPEPPECTCNSDCGTEDYMDNYCEDNKIYRDLRQFICNKGKCEKKITKELVKTCNNGCDTITNECNPETIICHTNSDCGTDGCIGTANYCKDDSVYQDFIYFTCHNQGQFDSYCSDQALPFLIKTCNNDYYSSNYCSNNNLYKDFHDFSCQDGGCSETIIKQLAETCEHGCFNNACISLCSQNSDCGTNGYIGDKFCKQDGNVYKNYKTFTCNNPNTTQSTCTSLIEESKIQDCEFGCNNGICNQPECTINADCPNGKICTNNKCIPQQLICQTDSDCGQQTIKNICQEDNLTKEIATPKCRIDNANNQNNKCENTAAFELIKECKYGCEIKNNIAKCDSVHINEEKCYDEYGDLIDCDEQAQLETNQISKKSSSSIEEIMKTIANQANISQSPTQYLKPLFQSESFSITYILYIILILILLILIIILILLAARKPRKKYK